MPLNPKFNSLSTHQQRVTLVRYVAITSHQTNPHILSSGFTLGVDRLNRLCRSYDDFEGISNRKPSLTCFPNRISWLTFVDPPILSDKINITFHFILIALNIINKNDFEPLRLWAIHQ